MNLIWTTKIRYLKRDRKQRPSCAHPQPRTDQFKISTPSVKQRVIRNFRKIHPSQVRSNFRRKNRLQKSHSRKTDPCSRLLLRSSKFWTFSLPARASRNCTTILAWSTWNKLGSPSQSATSKRPKRLTTILSCSATSTKPKNDRSAKSTFQQILRFQTTWLAWSKSNSWQGK